MTNVAYIPLAMPFQTFASFSECGVMTEFTV